MEKVIKDDQTKKIYEEFKNHLYYIPGSYDKKDDYKALNEALEAIEKESKHVVTTNRLFYLSLPPDIFIKAATNVGNLVKSKSGWNRIVVEKPFGRDSKSFEHLSKGLNQVFQEDEIYRMDHYIGKEVVQNLLVLRFANVIFDPLWNRSNIKSVQIIFKEQLGVEGRGGYFDKYGIIRDVMQNHLLQILALVAMEQPVIN